MKARNKHKKTITSKTKLGFSAPSACKYDHFLPSHHHPRFPGTIHPPPSYHPSIILGLRPILGLPREKSAPIIILAIILTFEWIPWLNLLDTCSRGMGCGISGENCNVFSALWYVYVHVSRSILISVLSFLDSTFLIPWSSQLEPWPSHLPARPSCPPTHAARRSHHPTIILRLAELKSTKWSVLAPS